LTDQLCQVSYNRSVAPGYFTIGLKTGWRGFVPGQFGMLEVPPVAGILLRRPFSFARQVGDITEILYKVVGKGTGALAQVPVGAALRLLGPLGHGFSAPPKAEILVGVAGGYGIAPFLQMAQGMPKSGPALHLLYGARSKNDIIYNQEFSALNVKLLITTEDGSLGKRGRVTELLEEYAGRDGLHVMSCGPMGLLKVVQDWSRRHNVSCELSVEETMGCGTGVCLGCVVKDVDSHYRRACIEGPIFNGEILDLSA